jgi:hypothetical protein
VPNTLLPRNQILRDEAEENQGNSYRNVVVDCALLVHFDRTGKEFVPIWNEGIHAARNPRPVAHASMFLSVM